MPHISEQAKRNISAFITGHPLITTEIGTVSDLEEIGEGGNAIAYSAKLEKVKSVVIKFLAEDCLSHNSTRFLRFYDEFRKLILLADSGLVASVYAFGYIETPDWKYPYIVMKLYPFTLAKWITTNPVRNIDHLKGMVTGLIQCLQLIHTSGIVHRDLKPENIFIARDGHPVLADFGIAWFDPEQYSRLVYTTQMELFGNRGFSAPEQRHPGIAAHPTMDLWALGQLIQWLVTRQPHPGGTRMVLAQVHRSFAPLDPIVDRLLQPEPAQRPQHTDQVATLIERAFH